MWFSLALVGCAAIGMLFTSPATTDFAGDQVDGVSTEVSVNDPMTDAPIISDENTKEEQEAEEYVVTETDRYSDNNASILEESLYIEPDLVTPIDPVLGPEQSPETELASIDRQEPAGEIVAEETLPATAVREVAEPLFDEELSTDEALSMDEEETEEQGLEQDPEYADVGLQVVDNEELEEEQTEGIEGELHLDHGAGEETLAVEESDKLDTTRIHSMGVEEVDEAAAIEEELSDDAEVFQLAIVEDENWVELDMPEDILPETAEVGEKQLQATNYQLGYWEIGVSFTPTLTNKTLNSDSKLGGLVNREFYQIADLGESASFSNNKHLSVNRHFDNGMYVGAGVGTVRIAEQINYDYTITSFPEVDAVKKEIKSYTELPPAAHEEVKYEGSNSYQFIDIPVRVGFRYDIGNNLQLGHEISLSYMLLTSKVGQKADYTYLSLRDLSELDLFAQGSLSSQVKTGVYLNFDKWTFGAEPIAGLNLTSLSNSDSPVNVRPYSYGFNLTTTIKLHKF